MTPDLSSPQGTKADPTEWCWRCEVTGTSLHRSLSCGTWQVDRSFSTWAQVYPVTHSSTFEWNRNRRAPKDLSKNVCYPISHEPQTGNNTDPSKGMDEHLHNRTVECCVTVTVAYLPGTAQLHRSWSLGHYPGPSTRPSLPWLRCSFMFSGFPVMLLQPRLFQTLWPSCLSGASTRMSHGHLKSSTYWTHVRTPWTCFSRQGNVAANDTSVCPGNRLLAVSLYWAHSPKCKRKLLCPRAGLAMLRVTVGM